MTLPRLIFTSTFSMSSDFWIATTALGATVATYMGVTWYRVKKGTGRQRTNYLAYLTTEKYRKAWEVQKTRPSYYATRLWIAVGWTVFSLVKATQL